MAAKKEILIVKDNLINQEVLGSTLSPVYEALKAKNDEEDLAFLKKQKTGLSLILLDIVMPVMDGYTFLSRVRTDAELALVPVVVTTQGGSGAGEVAALSYDAADFVLKPYRPEIILHRVTNVISLRETVATVNELQYNRLTGLSSKEYFYRCVRDQLDTVPGKVYDIIYSDIENFYWQAVLFQGEPWETVQSIKLLRIAGAISLPPTTAQTSCSRYCGWHRQLTDLSGWCC